MVHAILITIFIWGSLFSGSNGYVVAENNTQASVLIQKMSPQEKIGQLFLVTFDGTDISEGTQIYDLITNHHIGGVVLSAEQNNFQENDTVEGIYALTSGLQELTWQKTQEESSVAVGSLTDPLPVYVPLFIGISQEGNGYPTDQILSGLSPIPSAMALGATWTPALANDIGTLIGKELSGLGFNLYLGPSLDVVDSTIPNAASITGTRSFGGDPYWVGEMGKAIIAGLHQGSEGRLAVIAKHFPGLGGVDRSPDNEVSTVRKSLEQLKQLELAPFFAVTGQADSIESITDGLLVSPIRFQGFQGNIRATTKPVNFDSTALSQLMDLDEFGEWRVNGGLMVSDSLGSRALRRFYDPTEVVFESWQIARTAFLAGNDLLYLKDFRASGDRDEYTSILETLNFFTQKYLEDPLFAQNVDVSVTRILNQKAKQYSSFKLEIIIPEQETSLEVGNSTEVSSIVAQKAVTLISPSKSELDNLLPSPPTLYEYITIFTDVRTSTQCATCTPLKLLSSTSFESALLKLYGPQASKEILVNRLSSYNFDQLIGLLDDISEPIDQNLEDNLRRSDWVVFNILDFDPNYPNSIALKRLLSERLDLLQDKHVIVFAYDTPYYLDATEISKITAYYGMFSRIPTFVEVAARLLMQEIELSGALPISVSSIGYDLITATTPDPNQVISLALVLPEEVTSATPEIESTENPPLPMLKIGENVNIQAGVVWDHNHNPVPDGTIVRFTFRVPGENVIIQQSDVATRDGLAEISYRIDRGGILEVTASSEPALVSSVLSLNIESGIAEIFMPTATIAPTATQSLAASLQPTGIPTEIGADDNLKSGYPETYDWFIVILLIALGFGIAYLIGYYWWGSIRWGIRSGLCSAIGGLLSYIYLNLGVGGTAYWMEKSGSWFVIEMALVGLILGWIVALVWWMIKDGNNLP